MNSNYNIVCEHVWTKYIRIYRHANTRPTYGEMYRNCISCNMWQVGGEFQGRETWVLCTRPVVETVIYEEDMKR